MAVINLESLALHVQTTTGFGLVGMVRTDSKAASGLTPVSMSPGRHPAPQYPWAEVQPRSRRDRVDAIVDVDRVGIRAGRSERFAGVLVRRSPALAAGFAGGILSATAGGSPGQCQALPPTQVGQGFPQRLFTLPLGAERLEGLAALPRSKPLGKRGKVRAAWPMPHGGTSPASTRGKGWR